MDCSLSTVPSPIILLTPRVERVIIAPIKIAGQTMTEFKLLSEIKSIETIATGHGVYIRHYLDRTFGKGHWRKMKGIATVELADGTICQAEIHWFEAHDVGRRDFKVKKVIR
jgi:hypothetical protein